MNFVAPAFGQLLTVLAIGMVPIFFFVGLYKNRDKKFFVDSVTALFRPTPLWAPRDPVISAEYKRFTEKEGIDNPVNITDD